MTRVLFIGGVSDGVWKEVAKGAEVWTVPRTSDVVVMPFTMDIVPNVELKLDHYTREWITLPDGSEIEFYRYSKLTTSQSIRRLFDWYSPGGDIPSERLESALIARAIETEGRINKK